MVKKLKELAGDAGQANLAQTVRDSAQQIWLAGLGAFAKAQEEGGKVFEALVREGKSIESRTMKSAEKKFGAIAEQFGKKTDTVTSKATAGWDKLEQVFEDRVARALGRLGVPTQKDLEALAARLEELTATAGKAAPRKAAKAAAAAKSAQPTKSARKRTAKRASS